MDHSGLSTLRAKTTFWLIWWVGGSLWHLVSARHVPWSISVPFLNSRRKEAHSAYIITRSSDGCPKNGVFHRIARVMLIRMIYDKFCSILHYIFKFFLNMWRQTHAEEKFKNIPSNWREQFKLSSFHTIILLRQPL